MQQIKAKKRSRTKVSGKIVIKFLEEDLTNSWRHELTTAVCHNGWMKTSRFISIRIACCGEETEEVWLCFHTLLLAFLETAGWSLYETSGWTRRTLALLQQDISCKVFVTRTIDFCSSLGEPAARVVRCWVCMWETKIKRLLRWEALSMALLMWPLFFCLTYRRKLSWEQNSIRG